MPWKDVSRNQRNIFQEIKLWTQIFYNIAGWQHVFTSLNKLADKWWPLADIGKH